MILDRSYKMDAHAHNRIEIMLLVSGSLDVLFGFEATPPNHGPRHSSRMRPSDLKKDNLS